MGHSLITKETLAPLRARIGKPVERTTMPFYTEINSDAARHFANAIGDNNPLHTDPDYGASTRWKGQLAPPTVLYSTNNALSGAVEAAWASGIVVVSEEAFAPTSQAKPWQKPQ